MKYGKQSFLIPISLVALVYACGGTVFDSPDSNPGPDGGAPIGAACSTPSDCSTAVCTNGACAPTEPSTRPDASPGPATCSDGAKNGAETDVDCGGACPRSCGLGRACLAARDCVTGICTLGKCVGPSASDGIHNVDETDVDCGGSAAPPCAGGKACRIHGDCVSGACASGTCLASAPTQATTLASGTAHVCAILDNGALKCWGENECGQLGLGNTQKRGLNAGDMGDGLPGVDLGTGRTAKAVACGRNHTCALLDNNAVKCWGDREALGTSENVGRYVGDGPGEMGNDLPNVSLGTGRTARAIAAGLSHSCAILDDATLKCWGNNIWGAAGNGTNVSPQFGTMGDNLFPVNVGAGRTVKAVTAGAYHTCALLDIGSVKCWGLNGSGQLGQGHSRNLGNSPTDMGDNLPAVQLGLGRSAKAVSAGAYFTCALLDDGSVKCWGGGALGTGDQVPRGAVPGDMGDNLLPISLGTGRTARAISAGYGSACAILDDNSLKCWGSDALGNEDFKSRGYQPNEMGDLLPAAKLGTGRFARTVITDEGYTCAALDNNGVKCWGWNPQGQLGLGALGDRGGAPGQMGDNLPFVNLGTGRTLRLP